MAEAKFLGIFFELMKYEQSSGLLMVIGSLFKDFNAPVTLQMISEAVFDEKTELPALPPEALEDLLLVLINLQTIEIHEGGYQPTELGSEILTLLSSP